MKRIIVTGVGLAVLLCAAGLSRAESTGVVGAAKAEGVRDTNFFEKAVSWDGHRYAVHDKPIKWEEALAACTVAGGHLLQIDSKKENDFVLHLVRKCKLQQFWLDLTDQKQEGQWRTSSGAKQTFFHWGGGQPDNYRGVENYGVFRRTDTAYYGGSMKVKAGTWEDWISIGDVGCVCEWDRESATNAPAGGEGRK